MTVIYLVAMAGAGLMHLHHGIVELASQTLGFAAIPPGPAHLEDWRAVHRR